MTYTNTADRFVVQIPMLITHATKIPMSLYFTNMVSVQADRGTYFAKSKEYTVLEILYEYMMLT